MIHYHGTPISPMEQLFRMAGRHFCISFFAQQDLQRCLSIGQSVMFDNGAFSAWTRGVAFDESGFYEWIDKILAPPHWAVIPDVVDGDVAVNDLMLSRWPHRLELGAPVWHLHEPIERLLALCDEWPRICLGSSGEFRDLSTTRWCGRMDQCFNEISKRHARLPWIHGLRMLGQAIHDWPLASADSTNVAQNFKRDGGCAECKAFKIDLVQPPLFWTPRALQKDIFP